MRGSLLLSDKVRRHLDPPVAWENKGHILVLPHLFIGRKCSRRDLVIEQRRDNSTGHRDNQKATLKINNPCPWYTKLEMVGTHDSPRFTYVVNTGSEQLFFGNVGQAAETVLSLAKQQTFETLRIDRRRMVLPIHVAPFTKYIQDRLEQAATTEVILSIESGAQSHIIDKFRITRKAEAQWLQIKGSNHRYYATRDDQDGYDQLILWLEKDNFDILTVGRTEFSGVVAAEDIVNTIDIVLNETKVCLLATYRINESEREPINSYKLVRRASHGDLYSRQSRENYVNYQKDSGQILY
jgi:hypothetical protein